MGALSVRLLTQATWQSHSIKGTGPFVHGSLCGLLCTHIQEVNWTTKEPWYLSITSFPLSLPFTEPLHPSWVTSSKASTSLGNASDFPFLLLTQSFQVGGLYGSVTVHPKLTSVHY